MTTRNRPVRPFRERLLSKVTVDVNGPRPVDDAPCWEWTASKRNGYGQISRGRGGQGVVYAHRAVYEELHAPIPDGMELDHLCRNRGCVNPAHLEPVAHRQNLLRGNSFSAANAAKDACLHGHEFTQANTRIRPNGSRSCKACHRDEERARYARRRA
jgi:hypothetical protein